jgi:hypothetical protein
MNTCDPTQEAGPVQPTLIKKKELAKRLSVSPRSIDGWVSKRVIPYIQITPRFYLFEVDAVLAALKKLYQVETKVRD